MYIAVRVNHFDKSLVECTALQDIVGSHIQLHSKMCVMDNGTTRSNTSDIYVPHTENKVDHMQQTTAGKIEGPKHERSKPRE
jgi:hypothetical protein